MDTINWEIENVGKITLCPSRGRVLQVEFEGDKAYWNNPEFNGDWNIGGDRLWIAPEVDWYWQTLKTFDFDKYIVPNSVDPGTWKVTENEAHSCQFTQNVTLNNLHKKSSVQFELKRTFLNLDMDFSDYFKKSISYNTTNELQIIKGTAGQKVGIWSILQIPSQGDLYISCSKEPAFRNYFNSIADNLWEKEGKILRLPITGKNQYKIGFSADVVTGKIAYARKINDTYLVIYRAFRPNKWLDYCDVPISDLKSKGDAVQVYNDDGDLGGFGEIEYHTPAIAVGAGKNFISDTNLTIVGTVMEKDWSKWKKFWLK